MPARTRITRTSCGRWEVRTRGGDSAVLPTRALAEDYASAVETEEDPPARWDRRRIESIALALSTIAVTASGTGWTMRMLMESHPPMSPVATIAGGVALVIRVALHMRG